MLALPVPAFSTREALTYLSGRLTTDPDQRSGAIDLAADLGCDPAALAQAAAVIISTGISCREYRGYFVQRQAAGGGSGDPPTAAWFTWTAAASHAERLAPGAGTWRLLALARCSAAMASPSRYSPPQLSPGTWPARASTLGPGHRATIAAQVSLGRALAAAGKPDDAAAVLAEAADRGERAYGARDASAVAAREEYAAARLAAGNPAEAIGCYRRLLGDRERWQGPAHPGTLAAGAAAGRRLPDRRAGRGGHRPVPAGPGRPGADPGAGPPGHAGGPGQPGRRLRCRRADERRAAAARADLRRVRARLSPADPLTRTLRQALAEITGEMTVPGQEERP